MSANTERWAAFWCGIRWGLGHSVGLLIIGTILIIIDSKRNEDVNEEDRIGMNTTFTIFCEALVGIFMIFLGLYGMISAYLKHKRNKESTPAFPVPSSEDSANRDVEMSSQPSAFNVHNGEASLGMEDASANASKSGHDHNHSSCLACFDGLIPKPILSFLGGVLHGIAGPGGVLGVLPAVQLHNFFLALVYLITFCIVSTFLMGLVAALYGSISSYVSENSNVSNIELKIELFSAALSLLVGILWIFLMSIGKLDVIVHAEG